MRDYNWREATQEQKDFVGRIVREARLARDLDPKDAARAAGVSRSTFYHWENGRIASSTALLLHWLFNDDTESHDAFYWRERALLAEAALEGMQRNLQRYDYNRSELKNGAS
jgi:transcriptional regulator with XRE-family HTH domain